jgi:hypothetical protein
VWMIGEFGQLIDEGPYLLEHLIDTFEEESAVGVKLEVSVLTLVRLFVVRQLALTRGHESCASCVHAKGSAWLV